MRTVRRLRSIEGLRDCGRSYGKHAAARPVNILMASVLPIRLPMVTYCTTTTVVGGGRHSMAKRYDAIVIGTGQAGPPLAVRMADEGLKTAIIERKLFGGTCVNGGCTPTNTLVASARAAHMARRAKDFGVAIGGPIDVDMESVKARKDAIGRQSNEGLAEWLRGTENLTVYEGHARFETANANPVNVETLEAPRIFRNAE